MIENPFYISALAIAYVLCGILAFGITFGFFQRRFPSIAHKGIAMDRSLAFATALLGPAGLILAVCLSGFCKHGMKFK